MAYNIVISEDAHRDIDEIVSYIAGELHNPQAARDFLDDVEQSYNHIADNPFMYSLCNDGRLRQLGYRRVVIKNYLVLYRIDEKTAYIVRIVYSARDYAEFL